MNRQWRSAGALSFPSDTNQQILKMTIIWNGEGHSSDVERGSILRTNHSNPCWPTGCHLPSLEGYSPLDPQFPETVVFRWETPCILLFSYCLRVADLASEQTIQDWCLDHDFLWQMPVLHLLPFFIVMLFDSVLKLDLAHDLGLVLQRDRSGCGYFGLPSWSHVFV
jgi:hypothetical protein